MVTNIRKFLMKLNKFKESKKSICHNCFNINNNCSFASKVCDTDSKTGLAFVSKCAMLNKDISEKKYETSSVKVDNSPDSRIEMMGGGFKDNKYGNEA